MPNQTRTNSRLKFRLKSGSKKKTGNYFKWQRVWFIAIVAIIGGVFIYRSFAAISVSVTIDRSTTIATSKFSPGVTHTQYSLDSWGNAAAVASGKTLLSNGNKVQNQHIMGWGADNPLPSPGVYNWDSLDARVNTMRSTGASPMAITFCCAPDWMKGGAAGSTDWSKLEVAPLPDFYDDYARLAAEVATRYPDVTHFQVWNEFKGFYNASLNRWDYEKYTQLYNQVYDAVKAVRPDANLGGPYVVMDSWGGPQSHPSNVSGPWGRLDQRPLDAIMYWLKNKRGAQFLTVDGGNDNKDLTWPVDGYKMCKKYSAVMGWLRSLDPVQYPGGTTLPAWWAEWYSWPANGTGTLAQKTSVMAECQIESVTSGLATALIWAPQGDASGTSFPVGLWTDTMISGGGQQTSYYPVQKGLKDYFAPGTAIYKSTVSSDVLGVLAGATKTMLVSHSSDTLNVSINGSTQVSLNPYEVKFVDTPGSATPGTSPTPTINNLYIPEDINQDGKVNILDFSALSSNFGQSSNAGRVDINADGQVSILDFSMLAAKFGHTQPTSNWSLVFQEEFNGTSLDAAKWDPVWFCEGCIQNNVGTYSSNVAVTGGNLVLTLASANSGASVRTAYTPGRFQLRVGDYTEARVYFPGNGTSIYNWPAWWSSGPNWPAAGEHDIAEGLGTLTTNYQSPTGPHNQGTIPGIWSNAFHVYGVHRKATSADVYWDGVKVKSYPTDDNGGPQELIINVGNANVPVYGTGSQVKVDYVRAWRPAQ